MVIISRLKIYSRRLKKTQNDVSLSELHNTLIFLIIIIFEKKMFIILNMGFRAQNNFF